MFKTGCWNFGFSAPVDARSDRVVDLTIISSLVYKAKDSDKFTSCKKDFLVLHFCTLQYLESFGASGPSRNSKVSMFSLLPFVTLNLHGKAV